VRGSRKIWRWCYDCRLRTLHEGRFLTSAMCEEDGSRAAVGPRAGGSAAPELPLPPKAPAHRRTSTRKPHGEYATPRCLTIGAIACSPLSTFSQSSVGPTCSMLPAGRPKHFPRCIFLLRKPSPVVVAVDTSFSDRNLASSLAPSMG